MRLSMKMSKVLCRWMWVCRMKLSNTNWPWTFMIMAFRSLRVWSLTLLLSMNLILKFLWATILHQVKHLWRLLKEKLLVRRLISFKILRNMFRRRLVKMILIIVQQGWLRVHWVVIYHTNHSKCTCPPTTDKQAWTSYHSWKLLKYQLLLFIIAHMMGLLVCSLIRVIVIRRLKCQVLISLKRWERIILSKTKFSWFNSSIKALLLSLVAGIPLPLMVFWPSLSAVLRRITL